MLTRLSSTSARITEVGDAAERLAVLFKKTRKTARRQIPRCDDGRNCHAGR